MHATHRTLLISGILVLAVGLTVGTLYWLSRPTSPIPDTTPVVVIPSETPTTSDPIPGTPTTTPQTPSNLPFPQVGLPAEIASKVSWTQPQSIAPLGLLRASGPFNYEEQSTYEQIGSFAYNGQSGRVILLTVPADGLGPSTQLRFIELGGQFVLLLKYSDAYYSDSGDNSVIWEPSALPRLASSNLDIPLFDFPDTVVVKNTISLHQARGLSVFSPVITVNNQDPVLASVGIHGSLYTSTSTGAFYFVTPDGFPVIYTLEPDFSPESHGVPALTWNDGTRNTESYTYTTRGGCGSIDFTSVVTTLSVAKDLQVTGKTSTGAAVYELKDSNNQYLKEYYDNTYAPGRDGNKIAYAEFVKQHPMFFWVDPLGRLVRFTNDLLGSSAECGKPVIYLYPEQKTTVSVQVKPEGGLTYSDPAYGEGWSVVAEPTGELTEAASGQKYPYLFWEGRGGLYQAPKEGFVVKKSEVEGFLREKLAILGLNPKETADFMEFWLPRMQSKPYYFVTFLGTRQMDALAPLTISPKPDTVVRILMDFTPLDAPVVVKPLTLGSTPKRHGFTVIEWGGVLR